MQSKKVIILIKRGDKVDLPNLEIGELGYALDTNELFIGTVEGNKLVNIPDQSDYLKKVSFDEEEGVLVITSIT